MAEGVNEGEATGEASAEASAAQEPVHDLDMIRNISDFEKGILFSAGYDKMESLKDTTAEEFQKLKGITEDRAHELYEDIQRFFSDLEEKRLEEREKVREFLYSLPGVSKAVAERIYDSGYDTFDALKQASEEELMRIRGVGRSLAKNITEGMEERMERFKEGRPVSGPEEGGVEIESEPETKSGGGFLKGFMDKITGFLFKKDVTEPEEGLEGGQVEESAEGLEEEKTEFIEGTEEEEILEPEEGAGEGEKEVEEGTVEGEGVEEGETEVEEARAEEKKAETAEDRAEGASVTPPTEEEAEVKEEESEEAQYPTVSAMTEEGRSKAVEEFMQIEGINEDIAQALYDTGYNSLDELAPALAEDFTYVKGVDETKAEEIHRNVQEYFKDKGE